jgi:hypothetical protein
MTANDRLKGLAKVISIMFDVEIEITIRGLNDFTFSYAGKDKAKEIKKWLKKAATVTETLYDEELNETFIYFTGKI